MVLVRRVVEDEIGSLIQGLPALAIEGAKGVGKTTTARAFARTTYELDDPSVMSLLQADRRQVLEGAEPILIDEWQQVPTTWDVVRRAVDEDGRPGRFLLAGSSDLKRATHSGAGRIVRVTMRPLSLVERGMAGGVSMAHLLSGERGPVSGRSDTGLADYVREIVMGGFPGIRHPDPRQQRTALAGYVERIVDTDLPESGFVLRNPVALRGWLAAYAAAVATTTSYERIRDGATSGQAEKPTKVTTSAYTDALRRLWIIDPVPAWLPQRNHLKRLGSAPRHSLVDPAIAASLLRLDAPRLLRGDPMLGPLFECLVGQSLRVYAQAAEARVHHLRTHGGEHEVDYIVEGYDGRVVAVEVKLAADPDEKAYRHLHWLRDQMGDELADAVMVTTGEHAYRRRDGVAVVPAALLEP